MMRNLAPGSSALSRMCCLLIIMEVELVDTTVGGVKVASIVADRTSVIGEPAGNSRPAYC